MAFDPDAYLASTPAASTPAPAPGGFDPDAYLAQTAPAAAPAAPPPPPSTAEAVARGAAQGASFGFADEAQAAAEALFGQSSADNPGNVVDRYQRARDAIRAKYKAAQQAHPVAYGLSELGGGLLAPVPGGAAKTVAGAAARGALAGGIGALGSSEADLTRGDLGTAARDVALGAGAGGVLGAALHGAAAKLSKGAEDRALSDVTVDTMGRARPKDQLQARRLFLADKGKAELSARDILFSDEARPIVNAARAGDTEGARAEIASKLDELRPARTADYRNLDRLAGPVPVKPVLNGFDDAIAFQRAEGDPAALSILKASKKALEDAWSGVPAGMARAALRGAGEEEAAKALAGRTGTLTNRELYDLGQKLPREAREALEALPRAFDPSVKVPTVELRAKVTKAQDFAIEALGTIAETEHARLRGLGETVLTKALDEHLDQAAGAGPEAAKVVQQIRNRDKWFSTLLTLDKGLEWREQKALLKRVPLGDQIAKAAKMHGPMAAVPLALTGHLPAAAAAAAIPLATKAAAFTARRGNDTLARVLYAASKGDARAQRILDLARRVPARAAHVVGQLAPPTGGP